MFLFFEISGVIVIATNRTANNNVYIIINEIVRIRQLLFPSVTFLSLSEVSSVLNMSSLHVNTNLSNGRFLHEEFLISK